MDKEDQITSEELKWVKALARVMKRQPASVRLVVGLWSKDINIVKAYDDDPGGKVRRDAEEVGAVTTPFYIVTTG